MTISTAITPFGRSPTTMAIRSHPTGEPLYTILASRTFIAEQNGQIQGACNVLDMTANRGTAVLNCGGIAGVAVLPELRRSGVGSAMMKWLVRHLRETETPLGSLYAFREPFYRKFGYEVAGRRQKITCPTHRWPKLESLLPIRRLTPADWQLLVPCYEVFAHSRSGLNVRAEWHWKRVLGENRQLTIYAVGEPVEAYAVVSHVTAFWTTDHISELAWSTRLGYEGLLSMLGGLAINKAGLSWFEPSDGPFYADYLDQGVEISIERPIMFRVNDVSRSLVPTPARHERRRRIRDSSRRYDRPRKRRPLACEILARRS